jgi:hypothetical protein
VSEIKKVRYRVTSDCFGNAEVGDIREAYLLAEEYVGGPALLLHPARPRDGECASIEICRRVTRSTYESQDQESDMGYVNLERADAKRFMSLVKVGDARPTPALRPRSRPPRPCRRPCRDRTAETER